MDRRRALLALWVLCAGAVAWVWFRPLRQGALPPWPARTQQTAKVVEAPDDEPADDPVGTSVRTGPPERLDRDDLLRSIARVTPKVMACQRVEQVSGLVKVKMEIARSGRLQSAVVLPPFDKSRTADCVKHALRGLGFPRFLDSATPTIEWTYPFLFKPGA